jgi:hypothetical protein
MVLGVLDAHGKTPRGKNDDRVQSLAAPRVQPR